MEIIKETIKKVAEIKANAAKNAAEEVMLNGITFAEGIHFGEVEVKRGIEELSEVLGISIVEGYADMRGEYAYRIRHIPYDGVHFFESDLIRANEIPEGVKVAESREELYKNE